MVPSGAPTTATVVSLRDLLSAGDVVIDGGNTRYTDDAEHAGLLGAKGIEFVYRICAYLPLMGLLTIFLPQMQRL